VKKIKARVPRRTVSAAILQLCEEQHALALAKGFWADGQDHIAIKCERVHAEVSELCDTFARGTNDDPDEHCPGYSRAETEWADCLLRLFDMGGRWGFSPNVVLAKLEYNRARPLMHGGKKF